MSLNNFREVISLSGKTSQVNGFLDSITAQNFKETQKEYMYNIFYIMEALKSLPLNLNMKKKLLEQRMLHALLRLD